MWIEYNNISLTLNMIPLFHITNSLCFKSNFILFYILWTYNVLTSPFRVYKQEKLKCILQYFEHATGNATDDYRGDVMFHRHVSAGNRTPVVLSVPLCLANMFYLCLANMFYLCLANLFYLCLANLFYPCSANMFYLCLANMFYLCLANLFYLCLANLFYPCSANLSYLCFANLFICASVFDQFVLSMQLCLANLFYL